MKQTYFALGILVGAAVVVVSAVIGYYVMMYLRALPQPYQILWIVA